MMKKIGFFSLSIMVMAFFNLFADSIHSYQELTSAMRAGDSFVILVDFQQCTGKAGMPVGYLIPKAMMLVPAKETIPERVLTSDLHFTDHSGRPTYEYVKYTFNVDNTVMIQTTFYDPQDFKVIGSSHTINCTLGKGVDIYSDSDTTIR